MEYNSALVPLPSSSYMPDRPWLTKGPQVVSQMSRKRLRYLLGMFFMEEVMMPLIGTRFYEQPNHDGLRENWVAIHQGTTWTVQARGDGTFLSEFYARFNELNKEPNHT